MNMRNLSFEEAISHLRKGKKVKREGWTGFICILKKQLPTLHDNIILISKSGKICPDHAYTSYDVLANDWEVLEDISEVL